VQLDTIAPDERIKLVTTQKEKTPMKKLMTLMVGSSLLFGTMAVVFGQDTPKKDDTTKTSSKKKTSKKKAETPKKDGTSH
jgi:hypothetical protein